MKNELLIELYKKPQTVFTMSEIALLFPQIQYDNLKDRMSYFARSGSIKKLSRGIYAKDEYNVLELANKLYVPSYISLETVLRKAGVTFQYYETIFAVSYLTRKVTVGDAIIQYRQMKGEALTNLQGIDQKDGYFVASPERAFLDAVFIYKDYHFDNLGGIDWEKVDALKTIYANKAFEKRVGEYYKMYKEDYGKH